MNKNRIDKNADKVLKEAKRYSAPTITKLGEVNKKTLAGGTVPKEDSGSEWGPVS